MIFNLFKSKPYLKELIPDGFVDIHSHILPGIDDGANNLEESLKLISEMKKLRFSKIIGTPHTYEGVHNNTNHSIENSFKLIDEKINKKIISYASEYMTDYSLIARAESKTLLKLFENYILIEFSYLNKPENLYEIIFILITNGYKPILAHPERYRYMFRNYKKFEELKKRGVSFQMNLLASTGYYGKDVLKMTNKLLNNDFYDYVGSDIHHLNHVKGFYKKVKINNLNKFTQLINKNINLI